MEILEKNQIESWACNIVGGLLIEFVQTPGLDF